MHRWLLGALCGLVMLIAGCDGKNAGPGASGKPVVVSSIFPVHDLVRRVGGDAVEPVVLLKPGATVHGFNPSTKLAKTVARSKAAFVVGLELDDWAKKTVQAAGGGVHLVELGKETQTKTFKVDHVGAHQHAGHDDHGHEGHEGHGHEGHGHDDHGHDHGHEKHDDHGHEGHHHPKGVDPHVWLSVKNALKMVPAIERGLAHAVPEKKAVFAANAKRVTAELKKLDDELRKGVKGLKNKNVVTFHGSFGYFAAEYGLNVVAVIEPFAGKKPSAAYLKEVLGALKNKKVAALFTEPQLDKRPAEVLAKEAKLPLRVLDPLGGLDGRTDYDTLMRFNLAQLAGKMK